ncbi:membrane protein insertion efficiency factor YidD [Blastococcus sp. TBT05-19]|uniref:membrane protein insertion efficiency factor YidD n=1 Tax=Blastococcus sp. TBT05-19 TaxID=2250581 RepID=UPI000DE8C4C8|nr:membrane protein insertion efficiency factor YidD [Blastococcus sp. TBT05-19]RBY89131.1 membrane protein insertion efficiency factor YidD [Blastococcus sp. TBT05-19]
MVVIWSGGWGPRRRRPRRGGYRGHYAGHYGRGYGPPRRYGHRRGDDSCLRDLLFLNTGCCLANAVGCGMELVLMAPRAMPAIRAGQHGTGAAARLVAAVRCYQREISPERRPCCRFTPTCSAYAIEALEAHGALRGSWLTVRRLVRCRPGAAGGHDPAPA